MKRSHEDIVTAVLTKAKSCPGGLDLLGIYGSVATGDLHDGSDLDLLIVLHEEENWKTVTKTFILDDEKVGYDIYCTTWEMLEEDAECGHAQLGKLMDSELIYIRDEDVMEKLDGLRRKAAGILGSDERFGKAGEALQRSFMPYAAAMTAETMAVKRTASAYVISTLLDAVMLFNGRYFRKGTKRTFEELQGLSLPEHFEEDILRTVNAESSGELDKALTGLLRGAMRFLSREEDKEAPTAEKLRGTYEEMYSNWRNKVAEAAARSDVFSSFMNMAFLQYMLEQIAAETAIPDYAVMEDFSPDDLEANVKIFDSVLDRYLQEYRKAGMEQVRYPDSDAFVSAYLDMD